MEGKMIQREKQKQTPIKTMYFHRIVCIAVYPNLENHPTVDHINGHPADFRPENLRWISISDNNRCKKPGADYDKLYDILDEKNFV